MSRDDAPTMNVRRPGATVHWWVAVDQYEEPARVDVDRDLAGPGRARARRVRIPTSFFTAIGAGGFAGGPT